MATNLSSCFLFQFLEQLLKFLVNFTLLKYVKSQRSYGFLITKELIFGFQILDLKDHFSASLSIYAVKLSIKLSMSFSQRQKILKCLWSKIFELQKCGHTEKSNYGLNLSIMLMFLTIYGVGKSQCDSNTKQ